MTVVAIILGLLLWIAIGFIYSIKNAFDRSGDTPEGPLEWILVAPFWLVCVVIRSFR